MRSGNVGQAASRAERPDPAEVWLKENRKARMRWVDLEGLESRTLLATIPAAAATGVQQNLSSLLPTFGGVNASMSSSQVAVDPLDPSKLVTVWIDNDPAMLPATDNIIGGVLEAAYSINSGQSWLPLFGEPIADNIPIDPELLDPTTSGPTVPYKYVTDPSLGFDQAGNFYILTEYHNSTTAAASSSGAVVLQKYDFTGSAPWRRFHLQPADSQPLFLRALQPEGHLPVALLGQQ